MTIEEMRQLKRERGYTNEQISEWAKVPLGTVQKIFSGETKSPRYDTLQALERFFGDEQYAVFPGPVYDYPPEGEPVLVKEGNAAEAYEAFPQGKFTAEEYLRRREHERIELIDGVIYNLASPTLTHQFVITEVLFELKTFVNDNKGDCIPFPAPVSVYLNCDKKTVVEPDISIVCKRDRMKGKHIWGAPDLVIEVLSPSTRGRDLTLKQSKYAKAGVREYWVIDLQNQKVIVYDFEHDYLVNMYSFRDRVPVGIWGGQCEIDFAGISDKMMDIFGADGR